MQGKGCCLLVDYREKRCGIVKELEKYGTFFRMEITSLNKGDYLIDHRIIIERKAWTDFLQAIRSGRMFRQAYAMSSSHCAALLIIEGIHRGTLPDLFSAPVQGSLLHISLFAGVPVLFSRDKKETARLIYFTGRQLAEKRRTTTVYRPKRRQGKNLSMQQLVMVNILQGIPGVGPEKAGKLLQAFGSLRNLFNADREALEKVSGIGPRLADTIISTGTGSYDRP